MALHAAAFAIGLVFVHPKPPPRAGTDDAREPTGTLTAAAFESTIDEPPPEPEPDAEPPAPPDPVVEPAPREPIPNVEPTLFESDAVPVDEPQAPATFDEPMALPRSALGIRMRPAPPPSPAPPPERPPPSSPSPAVLARSVTEAPLRELEAPLPPPVDSIPAGVTLVVRLEYTITADGRVEDARIQQSSGDARLDESTRAFVVARWRYVPPGRDRRVAKRFVFTSEG